jgi:hypothetical protein
MVFQMRGIVAPTAAQFEHAFWHDLTNFQESLVEKFSLIDVIFWCGQQVKPFSEVGIQPGKAFRFLVIHEQISTVSAGLPLFREKFVQQIGSMLHVSRAAGCKQVFVMSLLQTIRGADIDLQEMAANY